MLDPPWEERDEHRSFIEAIVDRPDDQAPYLVFAEWLEEREDPRGEFIRVQCLLEDAGFRSDERARLREREGELLKEHSQEWLGDLANDLLQGARFLPLDDRETIYQWEFSRGFLSVLVIRELPPGFWIRLANSAHARFLRRVILDDVSLDQADTLAIFDNLREFVVLDRSDFAPDVTRFVGGFRGRVVWRKLS